MKTFFKALTGVAICSMLSIGAANAQTMALGPHDLTDDGAPLAATGIVNTQDLCRYCHAPHNADTVAPLWDRTTPAGPFTPYSSPSLTLESTASVTGVSLGCMSCHDGATSFDAVNGYVNGTPVVMPAGAANLGLSLVNDHPIGVTMLASTAEMTETQTTFPLFATKVECASCHNVHEPVGGNAALLRVDPAIDDICSVCHEK